MSEDEPLYQIGICPNCPPNTRQQFLFATEESSEPITEFGELVAFEQLEVFSLFRCLRCESILLYRTEACAPTGIRPDELDYYAGDGVARLNPDQFQELSRLLHSTKDESSKESILDPSTPETVQRCYEIGTKVRPISIDLYALQLRKTLEAICKDLGAPDQLESGRRAMLWQQIDALKEQNVVGSFIRDAAHKLKDISNTGAHYSESTVTEGDIRKLEHLLRLITSFVYGS
ncbi:MAG: DUF4145 domain-containing protein [Pyrinomonadaceae bacterium]